LKLGLGAVMATAFSCKNCVTSWNIIALLKRLSGAHAPGPQAAAIDH
jgi:hypothetical protein